MQEVRSITVHGGPGEQVGKLDIGAPLFFLLLILLIQCTPLV